MNAVRALLAWCTYPLTLTLAVGGTVAGVRAGWPPAAVVMGLIFVLALSLMWLERWMPHREAWLRPLAELQVDVAHMVNTGISTEIFRALTFGGLLIVATWLTARLGMNLWPQEAPASVQLGLALLIGDFGAYWVHRTAHEGTLIWKVHAMHHSSERLHTLSSGRNHPGNAILAYGSQVVPLILLGANTEVLATLSAFTAVHGMLQHCNADLRHGVLNHVFATADLHRWHHSTDFDESNTNFGSNLAIWDKVFGTWSLPHRNGPARVGLDDVDLPERFWAHLISPLDL